MCDCNKNAETTNPAAGLSATNNIHATPANAASADQFSAFQANLLDQLDLQRQLTDVRYRLLSTQPIESGEKDSAAAQPPR